MVTTAPPTAPRRFRFGLRSLFVVVTVVAICFWVANSLVWIRQRQAFLEKYSFFKTVPGILEAEQLHSYRVPRPLPTAPGLLSVFGESAVYDIHISAADTHGIEQARKLFPEATIIESASVPETQR